MVIFIDRWIAFALGIVVAIIVAIVMWFLLDRTTLGYELKSVGFNQNASQYAGMKVSRNVVLSMTIAGALLELVELWKD